MKLTLFSALIGLTLSSAAMADCLNAPEKVAFCRSNQIEISRSTCTEVVAGKYMISQYYFLQTNNIEVQQVSAGLEVDPTSGRVKDSITLTTGENVIPHRILAVSIDNGKERFDLNGEFCPRIKK